MKKLLLALTLVLVTALGLASFVFAQTPTPPNPQTPWGSGMSRGHMGSGGMWGLRSTGQEGLMHDYMEQALADALGIELEELQAARAEGTTMWQFAEEQGFSVEEFQSLMLDARQTAIEKMVADGVLTQEQADWMLSRMQGKWGQGGYGNSGCPGMGGGYGRSGGRWSNPSVPPVSNPTGTSL